MVLFSYLFNYFQLLDFLKKFFTFVSNTAVNILTYSSLNIKKLFLKISSQSLFSVLNCMNGFRLLIYTDKLPVGKLIA